MPEADVDTVSVHQYQDTYKWAIHDNTAENKFSSLNYPEVGEDTSPVLSGFFSFSSSSKLLKALTLADGHFIKGLNIYENIHNELKPIKDGHWLDFGHLQTFYQSRHYLKTARAFNHLHFEEALVTKSSEKQFKIQAEAHWFEHLPIKLKQYCVPYYGSSNKSIFQYTTGNNATATLNELFVFGRHEAISWQPIFTAIKRFHNAAKQHRPPKDIEEKIYHDAKGLYLDKTIHRLKTFSEICNIDIHREWTFNGSRAPSLLDVATISSQHIKETTLDDLSIIHGDLCFSNIFYDFRSQNIKLIDPRGTLDDATPTIYGDNRYDIAKLYHSVIGMYDHIVAEYSKVEHSNYAINFAILDDQNLRAIQALFDKTFISKADEKSILAINIQLFLSMLPLHSDRPNRQMAFIANSFRLFSKMEALM